MPPAGGRTASLQAAARGIAAWWQGCDVGYPVAVGIGSRVALYLLLGLFAGLLPGEPESKSGLLDTLARWDGQWYLSIARDGYVWQGPSVQSNVVFWPLYPALAKLAGFLLGDLSAGFLLVTTVSFLAFLAVLYRLAAFDFGEEVARRAVVFAAIFPGAFVLGAFYTEALSFALGVSAFYCARRGRWTAAIVLGFLTGLTRLPANAIILPMAYEWWRQKGVSWRMGVLGAVPLGAVAFVAYIGRLTGDPLAVINSQYSAWYRVSTTPWASVAAALERTTWPLTQYVTSVAFLDAGSILLFIALTVWAAVRMPPAYWIYAVTIVIGALSVGMDPSQAPPTASVPRFLMAVFPGYIGLGQWGAVSVVYQALKWTFALLSGAFAVYFFAGYWVL